MVSARSLQKLSLYLGLLIAGIILRPEVILSADSRAARSPLEQSQPKATATIRFEQRQEQVRQIRVENFDLTRFSVTPRFEKYWRNLLWTTAVVAPESDFVAATLNQILSLMTRSGLSTSQMRTVDMALKVSTQLYVLYPQTYGNLRQRFIDAIQRSPDPEWVAGSLSTLMTAQLDLVELQRLVITVKSRFPDWVNNLHLYTMLTEINGQQTPATVPPLADLLNWTIAPGQAQLYVLCRPNRDVLCLVVLKDRQGNFVRQADQLWSVPLLLKSLHHLNWNFVRGQTPQGLYRIEGSVPQPDDEYFRAYGQFALVNLFVPFETGVKQFLPGKPGAFKQSLSAYLNLFPPSWRSYFPIQQSYWAGRIGRSEFRIHGTGEASDFFGGKDVNSAAYNWNPTIGCLSALELYDEQGQLIAADMPKILDALRQATGATMNGYLIVVDVPGDGTEPVTLSEIEAVVRPIVSY